MLTMEVQIGGLFFTSNFDSGNLSKVEKVVRDHTNDTPVGSNIPPIKNTDFQPDYEFNVWTKPDCANTIYENGNRSWFHFGIRGASAGKLIKINIVNMNRQGRLYSQGYCPLVRTLPGKPKWERIRDKPSYETIDGQFILTFIHRFTELKGSTTYFAFAYPHSYLECQNQVSEIEKKFEYCKNFSSASNYSNDTIYFYRELLCHSLENLRIDLITISSFHGITDQEEPRFDAKLFPEKEVPRCRQFKNKRVFVLTSRVHPGETPASFVFTGFLNFILRNEDPRAIQLRKQFVFKLIPILNPDGVYNGHYRTDTRGVNLNRVYSDPSFELNPSIYAAKSLIIYYHVNYRLNKNLYSNIDFPPPDISTDTQKNQSKNKPNVSSSSSCSKKLSSASLLQHSPRSESPGSKYKSRIYDQYKPSKFCDNSSIQRQYSLDSYDISCRKKQGTISLHRSQQVIEPLNLTNVMSGSSTDSEDSIENKSIKNIISQSADCKKEALLAKVDGDLLSHLSTLTVSDNASSIVMGAGESVGNFHPESLDSESEDEVARLGNEGSDEDRDIEPALNTNITYSPHLNNSAFKQILPQHSGVAFYVDLHSHASRKGCFIYGNFLEDDELQIQNVLYPKLVSLNTAHFEFSACNFSQRNMYLRDKRDGLSKEGSGRVAVYKSTGIIHSYTLECNYNTGKVMNPVAPAYGDNGRASPPTVVGIPPKYTPSIFEDVGRAVAIAALDMNDTNPWSRVTLSEYKHVLGAKEWLKKYCLVPKGFTRPKNIKPPLRTLSFSHFSSNVPSRFIRASESFSSPGSGPASMSASAHLSSQMGPKKELRPVREASRRFSSCPRKLNLLVSDKGSISHSATKPPHSSYSALSGNTSQPFPSTRCKSLPVSKLSVQTTSSLSPCKLAQSSLSHSPSFDSYIPKTGKIGQLKSAPTIVRSKTNNSSSSVHKKPLGRSNLIRSMSGASDSHCVTVRYHSRSVDSPKFIATASSSHGRSHSFKQRYLHSTSDHAVATSKKKLSTDLTKRDGTSATPSSSEFNKKLTAESTTSEIPRNIPPKKKRRFSLLKKKQAAVNFLKGNIGKNILKDEHSHNVELEKLPRKRKKSSRHSLPCLAPLQVADAGSGLKLKEEGYTQSHSAKISSKHTKQVGQSMGVQGSVTNLSNKRNKKSKEQIWSTSQVYNETNLLPVQTSGQ